MLFSREKKIRRNADNTGSEPAWDTETVKRVIDADQIELTITSVELTSHLRENTYEVVEELKASGIMRSNKLVLVELSFASIEGSIGTFNYDMLGPLNDGTNIPLLRITLDESDVVIKKKLVDSHQAALLSGKTFSGFRIFKRKGESSMTEEDKEHGYSYESRYDITGYVVWQELQSENLPKWALPSDHRDFDYKYFDPLWFYT